MKNTFFIIAILFYSQIGTAQKGNYQTIISSNADKIEQKVIDWRHDFHQNPELGNRETRTSAIIAKQLLQVWWVY